MKVSQVLISFLFVLFFVSGCSDQSDELQKAPQLLRLATSSSTMKSGLLDELIPVFEKRNNIKVEVFDKGSGAALNMGRNGLVDVVLVHARNAEDKFIADGYGINRRDVMYNEFVLLGPGSKSDLFKNEVDILKVFQQISAKQLPFVSRGDNSGTHIREMKLWELCHLKPSGKWYKNAVAGMLKTLKMADELQAFVLIDRGTYLNHSHEVDLQVVFEGDKRLHNPYGVIAVSPVKVSNVNFKGAMAFIDFLTSEKGQAMINIYGREKYGHPLFYGISGR